MNVPGRTPLDLRTATFISGKVMVDDGTPLTDAALIQSICKGKIHNEGYTDRHGSFTFDLTSSRDAIGSAEESDSPVSGMMPTTGRPARNLRDCDLHAVLPGFTSQSIDLSAKLNDFGNADVGTIVLHRMAKVDGFTISATSVLAPSNARKEYEKGREEEKKEKWEAAEKRFDKAVGVYPKYAVAWFELGRVQLQLKKTDEARKAFQQAIVADEKFLNPYAELAQLALNDRQWNDLASFTGHIVELNPMSFPQFWFYNGLAYYYLQKFDQAEKSLVQALDTDVQHKIPKIEYLLGLILAQKHDYRAAMMHIRNYVNLSPNAPDAEQVQKQIAELERLSAPTTSQSK
jgi:tetratricopeptide (TPR) repeat protein